ncbi:MAG: uroporphyrinogen decarboxylase family protein [Solidesulfovibrio sp. DCME]|uniref:uroporphyrinogen decarboxylase family protein n=1 Tax=Solidesulfovibrio sp. DCME TaxID=3447380 RepID=UPI003D104CC9
MSASACGHGDMAVLPEALLARLGLTRRQVHTDAAAMARLARARRDDTGLALCLLPFCCTVEAEALGASIDLGDAVAGPRAGAFVCDGLRDVLALAPMGLRAGRLGQVLAACAGLARAGEAVALEISGPLTILNWLMDLTTVFKEWRRDEALFRDVLDRLAEELRLFALAAAKAGVWAVSFADPVGTVGVLGPGRFGVLADAFTVPFLRRLREADGFGARLHVCPRTAGALVAQGRATWREWPVDDRAFPGAAGLPAGHNRLSGEACLKNAGYRPKGGVVRELVLRP